MAPRSTFTLSALAAPIAPCSTVTCEASTRPTALWWTATCSIPFGVTSGSITSPSTTVGGSAGPFGRRATARRFGVLASGSPVLSSGMVHSLLDTVSYAALRPRPRAEESGRAFPARRGTVAPRRVHRDRLRRHRACAARRVAGGAAALERRCRDRGTHRNAGTHGGRRRPDADRHADRGASHPRADPADRRLGAHGPAHQPRIGAPAPDRGDDRRPRPGAPAVRVQQRRDRLAGPGGR